MNVLVSNEVVDLIKAGFRILPCREFTKIPKIPGWPEAASRDMGQIEDWLKMGPCNWAVLLEPDMFVIDVESHEPGFETFLPATLQAATPRGGNHYYYRGNVPDIAVKRIVSGVEVYGPGRTVMVPPSVVEPLFPGHAGPTGWTWRSSATFPIATAPDYLMERILK